MKKLSAMMALACLAGSSAAYAIAPQMPDMSNVNIKLNATQKQALRTMQAQGLYDATNGTNQENYETRSWVDPRTGNTWTFQVLKETTPLCEMLGFTDDQGNEFQYSFEELPLYCVNFVLWMENKSTNAIETQISFILEWPCYYLWNQAFEWEGVVDETGNIPSDLRNYDCVTPDDLMNTTTWCHKFMEMTAVGGQMTSDGYNWEYLGMLPNELLGFQGMCNGQAGFTTITDSSASTIEFKGYESASQYVSFQEAIYFTSTSGTRFQIRNSPEGTARMEGFTPRDITFDLGDLYLFNMGAASSEDLADTNPYPESWPELSQFYFMIGDPYVVFTIDPSMTKFDKSKIGVSISNDLPANEDLDAHANYIRGMLYAEPSYSKEQKNLIDEIFYLIEPEQAYDEVFDEWYGKIAPAANTFVGAGYEDTWSTECGVDMRYHNFADYLGKSGNITIGNKNGFQFSVKDYFQNTIFCNSEGKCHYYYDPNDVTKVREYSLVGSLDFDSVETVAAESAVKVSAANGEINIAAGEDAEVAIYALSGELVKSVKVAAGNAVSVAAAKGVYVVVANGKAAKVVL